jgi:hypothetical protein
VIGAAVIGFTAVFGGPSAEAHAAGKKPDFKISFFADTTSPLKPGEGYNFVVFPRSVNDVTARVDVTVLVPSAFGKPTIVQNPGYACFTNLSNGILGEAWEVTCVSNTPIQDSNSGIEFHTIAATRSGQYGFIASVWPHQGRDAEADESDNVVTMKKRVS